MQNEIKMLRSDVCNWKLRYEDACRQLDQQRMVAQETTSANLANLGEL